VPTSVLLAVLAAAGLLALAPALVRRYDATERLAAEREASTARVLDRQRRSRTVPGRRPVRPPASASVEVAPERPSLDRAVWLPRRASARRDPAEVTASRARPVSAPPASSRSPVPAARAVGRARVDPEAAAAARREAAARRAAAAQRRARQSPVIYRRRRVLAGLVALNIVELIGVGTVSSGFWTGFAVTALLLVGYLVHLRNEAIADRRRRRAETARAEMIAIAQAEIRAAHAKRQAARRDALRRAAAARAAAQREAVHLSQRYVDFDPARRARVRGRAYDTSWYDGRAVGE